MLFSRSAACLALGLALLLPSALAQKRQVATQGEMRRMSEQRMVTQIVRGEMFDVPQFVSGNLGNEMLLVGAESTGPIAKIRLGKLSGTPCYLEILFWGGIPRISSGTGDFLYEVGSDVFNGCGKVPDREQIEHLGAAGLNGVEGDRYTLRRRQMYGIQTLHRNNLGFGRNYRVDQLAVFYDYPEDEGHEIDWYDHVVSSSTGGQYDSVTGGVTNRNFSIAHDNGAARICPSGMALVGLYVHYRTQIGPEQITGLSPLCSEILEEEVPLED